MVKVVTNSQGKVYTANGKALVSVGGTPSGTISIIENGTYDVTDYANANVNVSGGGSKYGAKADTFLGDVNANGVLQLPTEQSQLVFTGVKNIVNYGLHYKFSRTAVTSVSFPSLTTISGNNALDYGFYSCSMLTSVSFPSLTTISGNNALDSCFDYCSGLTSVSFPSLTTISGVSALNYGFSSCSGLTSVSFPSLTTISGDIALRGCFTYCSKIANIYFNKVTTSTFASRKNQFNNIFNSSTASTSGTVNVHFPSNLSSTVSGLTGYPTFGGNSARVVLKFDLTATS